MHLIRFKYDLITWFVGWFKLILDSNHYLLNDGWLSCKKGHKAWLHSNVNAIIDNNQGICKCNLILYFIIYFYALNIRFVWLLLCHTHTKLAVLSTATDKNWCNGHAAVIPCVPGSLFTFLFETNYDFITANLLFMFVTQRNNGNYLKIN